MPYPVRDSFGRDLVANIYELNRLKKMQKKYSQLYAIILFILAQVACLSLLGLWIARFVANHVILKRIGEQYSINIQMGGAIAVFVIGLVLLVAMSVGISLIFRRLRLQQKLTKLYDNFLANITHELKTPLASIQLYLDTLGSRDISRLKQLKFIEYMQKDAGRLNKLINAILEIAQLEKKKNRFHCSTYKADHIVKEIIEEITKQVKLPHDTIIITGSAYCNCVVDKSAFKILFENLVDNAIKYSTDKLKININLQYSSKKCIIEFKDQGIGFPATEKKRIFDKFYRANQPNVPDVRGSGLGLTLVKEIIKYHGGNIRAYSEGVNRGATFRIELPVYPVSKRHYLNKLLKSSTY